MTANSLNLMWNNCSRVIKFDLLSSIYFVLLKVPKPSFRDLFRIIESKNYLTKDLLKCKSGNCCLSHSTSSVSKSEFFTNAFFRVDKYELRLKLTYLKNVHLMLWGSILGVYRGIHVEHEKVVVWIGLIVGLLIDGRYDILQWNALTDILAKKVKTS